MDACRARDKCNMVLVEGGVRGIYERNDDSMINVHCAMWGIEKRERAGAGRGRGLVLDFWLVVRVDVECESECVDQMDSHI